MSSETERRALSPPQITDASDNDAPDEVLELLGKPSITNWPPVDCNLAVVDRLTAYGVKLANRKAIKSVLLAVVSAVAIIYYTYILLNVR